MGRDGVHVETPAGQAAGLKGLTMTLASDGGPCAEVLRGHRTLATRRAYAEKKLADVRAAFERRKVIQNRPVTVFCVGSLARMEAGIKSDLDLFVTAGEDDNHIGRLFEIELFSELMAINKELGFPTFSNDGEYLQIHRLDKLKSRTGSRFDDSENLFTARMLLILESRPVANDRVYGEHVHEILEHYYRDRKGERPFRPVFLLNDLLRYWRTICLNYEQHRHDPNQPFRKKNVNLKFSRMLTVFGTVLPLVSRPVDTVGEIEALCEKTPLERLAAGLDLLNDSRLTDRWSRILDEYEEFLSWKNESDVETFLTKHKTRVTELASNLSAFLYNALTHKKIPCALRRALVL